VKITNFGGKSKKGLLAVTLVTVLSILAVVAVYSAFIETFTGGQVTVGQVASSSIITYNLNNDPSGSWTQTLNVSASGDWYARLEVAAGYTGPVTINWTLQQESADGSTWSPTGATVSTSVALTGGGQSVYASSDGTVGNNYDWGLVTTNEGGYRVVVTVDSA
jgi:hypothetical protein